MRKKILFLILIVYSIAATGSELDIINLKFENAYYKWLLKKHNSNGRVVLVSTAEFVKDPDGKAAHEQFDQDIKELKIKNENDVCSVIDSPIVQYSKLRETFGLTNYVSTGSHENSTKNISIFLSKLEMICHYPNENKCYFKNGLKPTDCSSELISLIYPTDRFPVLKMVI
jgi:hypothetical protein